MITKKNRVVVSKREFNADEDKAAISLDKLTKLGAALAVTTSAGLLCIKTIRHFKKHPKQLHKYIGKTKKQSN